MLDPFSERGKNILLNKQAQESQCLTAFLHGQVFLGVTLRVGVHKLLLQRAPL